MHPQADQSSESAERQTPLNIPLNHQPDHPPVREPASGCQNEELRAKNQELSLTTIGGLAELLGCGRLEIRHYANVLGLRFTTMRVGPRQKRIACLTASAAAAITAAFERDVAYVTASASSSSSSSPSAPRHSEASATPAQHEKTRNEEPARNEELRNFPKPGVPRRSEAKAGYIALLQLEPQLDPRRVQIVFNKDREGRLDQFLKSTPYARCLAQWPACASWETVAVESITRTDAARIHSQIFDPPNPAQLIANGHSLFALLPKPPLPTPDFQTHPPIESRSSRPTPDPTTPLHLLRNPVSFAAAAVIALLLALLSSFPIPTSPNPTTHRPANFAVSAPQTRQRTPMLVGKPLREFPDQGAERRRAARSPTPLHALGPERHPHPATTLLAFQTHATLPNAQPLTPADAANVVGRRVG